jgi:hypothetical protein
MGNWGSTEAPANTVVNANVIPQVQQQQGQQQEQQQEPMQGVVDPILETQMMTESPTALTPKKRRGRPPRAVTTEITTASGLDTADAPVADAAVGITVESASPSRRKQATPKPVQKKDKKKQAAKKTPSSVMKKKKKTTTTPKLKKGKPAAVKKAKTPKPVGRPKKTV